MGNVTAGTKIPCRVRRTLDVGDFSLLHQLTGFNMAIHSDAEYAKGTWFRERALAGPVIFAVADGLVYPADTVAELLGVIAEDSPNRTLRKIHPISACCANARLRKALLVYEKSKSYLLRNSIANLV